MTRMSQWDTNTRDSFVLYGHFKMKKIVKAFILGKTRTSRALKATKNKNKMKREMREKLSSAET